jgi:hypothetical protein
MPLFRHGSADLPVVWERKPWWRVLSLGGWGLLALGEFATLAFVAGLVSGQVLLLLAIKSKSGPIEVSYQSSPLWFVVCMALNFVAAVTIWALFIAWLWKRQSPTSAKF